MGMCVLIALSIMGAAAADADEAQWTCDEPGWAVTFQDDFDGKELNASSWTAINNVTHGPTEKQLYLADEVFVRDGALVLRTRKRRAWHEGIQYNFTSGWVEGKSKRFKAYGRFEVRAKLPSPAAGRAGKWPTAWPAHWLMPEPSTSDPPNVCWPVGGEIDIMEGYRSREAGAGPTTNHSSVLLSYHWATECGKDLWESKNMVWPVLNDSSTAIDWTDDFHTFAIDWSPEALIWLIDGTPRYTRKRDDPMKDFFIPNDPFYMILNTALEPWSDPDLDAGFPLEHVIDRVRWCQKVPPAEAVAAPEVAEPAPSPPSCLFPAASGRHYDLSSWRGRTIVARAEGGGTYNISLCGDLPSLCRDSLTGATMPPGNVFSMFEGEKKGTCWDVLAHWKDLVPQGQRDGLSLLFSHSGDAHLGCVEQNVTVAVEVACNPSLPRALDPVAKGAQDVGSCHWDIRVETADEAVCSPG